jgi:chitodextrinase
VVLAAAALCVALSPGRALAADTQQPSAPGVPVVVTATTSSVTLTWTASTDDVGVVSYQVPFSYTDVVDSRNSSTTNSITISGLRASMTYRFSVAAFDAAGNRSPQSPGLTYTMPPGDAVPPTAPGRPVVTELTPTALTLSWPASRENVSLGRYQVFRLSPGEPVQVATVAQHPGGLTSTRLRNLTPGTTYTFAVDAVDDAGNVSARSPAVSVTTPVDADVTCEVTYRIVGQWPGGFQASVGIRNLTAAPIPYTSLSWQFPNGQVITAAWQVGQWTMSGATATVTAPSWYPTINPSSPATFGFQGRWSGTNGLPTAFRLNGTLCSTA